MTAWLADLAWVDGAVRERVGFQIDAGGRLAAVTPGTGAGQRAVAGLAEGTGPDVADLRRWREVNGRLVDTGDLLAVLIVAPR
jgi:hypothetical protein